MQQYFADTWFFIARFDRDDSHHRQAVRLAARYPSAAFVTHDSVLMELLAYFSAHGAAARRKAVDVVRDLVLTTEVIPGSRTLFTAALDLYATRLDKEYSLVDCMSMVLMRERGITHILTNDHHFTQERFTVLSDAP